MPSSSQRARVLLSEMPLMLREIVERTLSVDDSVEVVAARAPLSHAGAGADSELLRDVDVVVGAFDIADPDWPARLLDAHPQLRIVVLLSEARRSLVYTSRPTRICLGDLSPDQLLEVVRSATPEIERDTEVGVRA